MSRLLLEYGWQRFQVEKLPAWSTDQDSELSGTGKYNALDKHIDRIEREIDRYIEQTNRKTDRYIDRN